MKKPSPSVLCEVVFLSQEEGGRSIVPPLWNAQGYRHRPHIVVEDISQRHSNSDNYLGVAFVDATGPTEAGEAMLAQMEFMYHPDVDYSALTIGARFTIREGARIVGHGEVVG